MVLNPSGWNLFIPLYGFFGSYSNKGYPSQSAYLMLCHERLQDTGSNRGYKSRGSNPWMHELKENKKQKAVHGSNLHGQQSVHCPSKTMNSECRNQSVHRKLTLSTPANCLPRVSNIYSHRASGTKGRLSIGRSVHRPAYSVAWSLSYEVPGTR